MGVGWWQSAYCSEVHGGFPAVIGNGVESPIEQLIDQHWVVPWSSNVKGCVPAIVGQAYISSILQQKN